MRCPNCGTEIEGGNFCSACGAPLEWKGEGRRCPACGARVAKRAKTCLICGAILEERRRFSPISTIVLPLLAVLGIMALLAAPRFVKLQPTQEAASPSSPSPMPTPSLTATATPTPTATPTLTPTPTPTPTPQLITHTVKRGETLILIAEEYGTTVEAIMASNEGIDPQRLRVGQELIIPREVGVPTPQPMAEAITYTVKAGDSLISIAEEYGTTVEAIVAANEIADPHMIRLGQELIIPAALPTPTPTATPSPTPTGTPAPPYPAPALLTPADEEVFLGEEADILLSWTSVGILSEDEWYVVHVHYTVDGKMRAMSEWTQATSWRVPATFYSAQADSSLYRWNVIVMRQTGMKPDGTREGVPVSPLSETRSFLWH